MRLAGLVVLLLPLCAPAQVPDSSDLDLDRLLLSGESEPGAEALLERVLALRERPTDLNTATDLDLLAIPGVSDADARAILALRLRLGRFTNAGQLDSLEHERPGLAAAVRPFVTAARARIRGARGVSGSFRTRLRKDLRIREGFLDGSYAGSRLNAYSRIIIGFSDDLEAGALVEKDAGERWAHGLRSGYMVLRGLPWGLSAVAGDYTVHAAQGLVLAEPASFERVLGPSGAVRSGAAGVSPNRSASESGFLRGAALTAMPPGFGVTAFFSSRRRTASLNENGEISAFPDGDLFRTAGEIRTRNAVVEMTVGGRVETSTSPAWSLGATACRSALDRTFHPDAVPAFRSPTVVAAGLDGRLRTESLLWFAEAARATGGGEAIVCGVLLSAGLRTEAAVVYRSFGAEYVSLRSSGFGRDTRNERGVLLSIESVLSRTLRVTASFDHYRHPWHTPDRVFPSGGVEAVLQAEITVRPRLDLAVRYTHRGTETGETETDPLAGEHPVQVSRFQNNLRMSASIEPDPRLRWRTRVEGLQVETRPARRRETGLLVYTDIRYTAPAGFTLEARLAFFDAESYDARVYAYENDLRGVFTSPPLYGRGSRWYLLLRSPVLLNVLTFSCKYAATRREGVDSMGSGDAEIAGDIDDRLSVQADMRW